MTLQELQTRSHNLAREKGWWDGKRDPDEVFACFHEEISECWQEYRSGRNLTSVRLTTDGGMAANGDLRDATFWEWLSTHGQHYYKVAKPEGFMVELADLVIRIADAAQAWGMVLRCEADVVDEEKSVATLICVLHGKIHHARYTRIYSNLSGNQDLCYAVELCFAFAKQHGVDLSRIVDLKHQYNLGRPRKHNKIA